MSQIQSAFLIDKRYSGPLQVEGYARKQSKKPDLIDKTIYFRIDLDKRQFEHAPTKLDFNKAHKMVAFSEILEIHQMSQESQKSWGYFITFEYKAKMKRPLTLILETVQIYQQFVSAISSIYDVARKVHLLIYNQKQIQHNQEEYLNQKNVASNADTSKLTIKRRVDIYKKRNQSASSTRQNNQNLNKTYNLDEEPRVKQVTENLYSQELSKKSVDISNKSEEIALDQYQNHFFGRCVNRVIKTVNNPESSKVLQENQENKNAIKPKNEKNQIENNISNPGKSHQQEVGVRKNFRYQEQNYGNDDQNNPKNYNQNVSQTVPQTNIHTKRPSIFTDRDQTNPNQYNSIATPYNKTISTITPRHSSISARSRKYKRQKNISFDHGNPSQTLNFYAESNKKGSNLDNQIDKLNKTALACNYYEPQIDANKQQKDIDNNSQQSGQSKNNDQEFYPSFAKNTIKNQKITAMNQQDQSEWSLASIKSPKIKSDDNQKDNNPRLFFPEQKKIKIIRKRSSKLSSTIEDENDLTEFQNQLKLLQNQNNSSEKSNHLLSDLSKFKLKTEQQDENYESIEENKQEMNKKLNFDYQDEQLIMNQQHKEQKLENPKLFETEKQNQQDTFNQHKDKSKQQYIIKQQQENIQQMQHSSLLRPNSSYSNNQNQSSPKKYGNIPKPQSGQKSGQKNIDLQKNNLINDLAKQQKPQMSTYYKQLYDFNQNIEMNDDDNITENEGIDIDAYKIILQKDNQNEQNVVDEGYSQRKKANSICKNDQEEKIILEKKKQILDEERNKEKISERQKSISPLKNQTNKIQQQINNQKQEDSSYLFNQQKNDIQLQQTKISTTQQKTQPTITSENNQFNQDSFKNLFDINVSQTNFDKQDSNEKNAHDLKKIKNENEEQKTQKKENQLVGDLLQENNLIKSQNSNTQQIKEIESKHAIEYHDFDNSFDKDDTDIEIFSQIKKVDEIIKVIENQTTSLLQNKNQLNMHQEEQKTQYQQKQKESYKISNIEATEIPSFDDLENQQQSINQDQIKSIGSDRSIEQPKNQDQNYDWICLKDPNYKPSTSPLKERLYVVEDEIPEQKQNVKSNENNNKPSELMIVMVNKNQNTQIKKKEIPILRQRDVFSDEFWNPVTQPKNYKITNQPPNLNEIKSKNKQVLVPVKVVCESEDINPKETNKEQKQQNNTEKCQKNENKALNNKDENENKNNQNQVQQDTSYQNTNIFDEVKDFFKIQAKQNNQKQQKQNFNNNNNNPINNQNQQDSKANQTKVQNNYDDWDDYY